MSYHEAGVYRQRATNLRELARQMRDTPSMSLHLHAGVDTWYGPHAEECTADLAIAQRAIHHAADDLDTQAFRFDGYADELVAIAQRTERLAEPTQR